MMVGAWTTITSPSSYRLHCMPSHLIASSPARCRVVRPPGSRSQYDSLSVLQHHTYRMGLMVSCANEQDLQHIVPDRFWKRSLINTIHERQRNWIGQRKLITENSSGRENWRTKNKRKPRMNSAGWDHDKRRHQTQLQWIEINSTRSNEIVASSQPEPARELKKCPKWSVTATTLTVDASLY